MLQAYWASTVIFIGIFAQCTFVIDRFRCSSYLINILDLRAMNPLIQNASGRNFQSEDYHMMDLI